MNEERRERRGRRRRMGWGRLFILVSSIVPSPIGLFACPSLLPSNPPNWSAIGHGYTICCLGKRSWESSSRYLLIDSLLLIHICFMFQTHNTLINITSEAELSLNFDTINMSKRKQSNPRNEEVSPENVCPCKAVLREHVTDRISVAHGHRSLPVADIQSRFSCRKTSYC